jgi:hypothetical protein
VVKDGKVLLEEIETPAILNGHIQSLQINDERYYTINLDFGEAPS